MFSNLRKYAAKMVINGVEYVGRHVTIRKRQVWIDGDMVGSIGGDNLEIRITEGVLGSLTTDANVISGDVHGDIDAGGSVTCADVAGDITAGGSVTSRKVGGDVSAGGSVSAHGISGSVDAGGSVTGR